MQVNRTVIEKTSYFWGQYMTLKRRKLNEYKNEGFMLILMTNSARLY